MDSKIERALTTDGLIDITTVGRQTGKPHKIEIAFHNFDGVLYISGLPIGPFEYGASTLRRILL